MWGWVHLPVGPQLLREECSNIIIDKSFPASPHMRGRHLQESDQEPRPIHHQLLQQHIAKSKDFQKNPEEESLASEIGMLEVDEITMKVCLKL